MPNIRGCLCVIEAPRCLQSGLLIPWFIPPLPSHLLSHGDLQPEQTTSSSFHLSFTFTSHSGPHFLDVINLGWLLHVKKRIPNIRTILYPLYVCVGGGGWILLLSLCSKEHCISSVSCGRESFCPSNPVWTEEMRPGSVLPPPTVMKTAFYSQTRIQELLQ